MKTKIPRSTPATKLDTPGQGWPLVRRLVNRLYSGARESLIGYQLLGATTAVVAGANALVKCERCSSTRFLDWFSEALSKVDPVLLLVAIFVACICVALRGSSRKQNRFAVYALYPVLGFTSDATTTATGFFAAATLLAVLGQHWSLASVYFVDWAYYAFSCLVLWASRALCDEHADRLIFGRTATSQPSGIPRTLRWAGCGGAIASAAVIAALTWNGP